MTNSDIEEKYITKIELSEDYLSQAEFDIKDVVYATGVPRLRVVPIGGNSEGAAEYFSSDKMQDFVDEM